MTQNTDHSTLLTPTRRRPASAVPVLIQIPDLAPDRPPTRRVRRRRLRREVRVAGYALAAILPIALVLGSMGGARLPHLAASKLETRAEREPEAPRTREVPAISLSLEPVAVAPREVAVPVFLEGRVLPADSSEEDGDGRY